jgi:hypothetical protein
MERTALKGTAIDQTTRATLMLSVILQDLTARDVCKDFIERNLFSVHLHLGMLRDAKSFADACPCILASTASISSTLSPVLLPSLSYTSSVSSMGR